jgi:hypothetical protein
MAGALCTKRTNLPRQTPKENYVTISGLLTLGAAEVVDPQTQEFLGYAFTIAHGKGQLQRWLLFRNPRNLFEIRKPSAAMAGWSLEDWQKNVDDLWRPNAYYVWAQADVYEYGETYGGVTWNRIPSADLLPTPSFPERPGSNFQLDYLTGKLLDVLQEEFRGRAYVVRGISAASSIEYWSLPAAYRPAGAATARVAVGSEAAGSLERFVEQCQSSWVPGSTFVITGCLNYQNAEPPFAP